MKYIVETPKSVDQTVVDLQAAVQLHKFGVLHIHNLQETLKKKGVDFPNACQILEICNPQKAKEVLTEDMDLNMAFAMSHFRLFRGWQDKDRYDETIRDAESAFRFPSLGPRSAGGRGDDHRNDCRSQVALSFGMVIRAREPGVHRRQHRKR
jgi:hypothetical protein